ncbi:MAG: glutamate--tRNA ligase [Candidatus Eisenbacteria bacterium]
MSDVRVRLAPSPTGFLHLGVARTALYNWLAARAVGGSFVLRIEDTDRERSTDEYLKAILEDLSWLGLHWDEGPEAGGPYGPYLQSERATSYADYVQRLLASGAAYRCFCTPAELEERRSARDSTEAAAWKYDRKCESLSSEDSASRARDGGPFAVRFRVPGGRTSFEDVVQGRLDFDNSEFDDLVIARTDGTPTYNFAVVVDDIEMRVNYVIRGSDHITNTPRQIMLWRALGQEPPRFAHMPLILAQDGLVLSKRRGAVAIGEYRRQGYLPEAIVNYVALLGWACADGRELLSPEELVGEFDLSRISRTASTFDPDKLAWVNAQWIKRLDVEERTDRLVPVLREAGLLTGDPEGRGLDWLRQVVAVIDDRLKTLRDILEFDWFFLASDVDYDSIAVSKVLSKPGADDILAGLHRELSESPEFTPEALEPLVRAFADEMGLSAGKVIQPLRVAVTGKTVSPGMFETLSLLGRDRVLKRIEKARQLTS